MRLTVIVLFLCINYFVFTEKLFKVSDNFILKHVMEDDKEVYDIPFMEIKSAFQKAQMVFGRREREKHSFLVTRNLFYIKKEMINLYDRNHNDYFFARINFNKFTKVLLGAIDMAITKINNEYEITSCYVSYDGELKVKADYFWEKHMNIYKEYFDINHLSWLTLAGQEKMCKDFHPKGKDICLE